MKTYQSGTKEKKGNFFKRHWHAFVVAASVIVVAAVVTLSVLLTLPDSKPVEGPIDTPPPVVDVEPKIVAPTTAGQSGNKYAYDTLVHWDTLQEWRYHPAVDFVGEGNVVSIMDGTVTAVDMHTTLDGNVVTVTHAGGYVSYYKSLGDEIAVKVGDSVKAGDKLGVTSDSMMSELNSGAHLHLEVKKDGKYIDPATLFDTESDK